jgi:hypothetical protein
MINGSSLHMLYVIQQIEFGERICQFRIMEKMPEVEFVEVEQVQN